jgi:two-component system sensor histidine kinase UhpB
LTAPNGRQYRQRVASRLPGQAAAVQVHPALDLSVFRQMADMSNDAFYLCDVRGRFLYVNGRSLTLGGYTREEMLHLSVPDINPDYPPDVFDAFVSGMGEGTMPPFETVSKRKDGTVFPIEISVARINVEGVPYLFGVVRDISERKQLEAARKTFTQRMLQTLENERQRVARELHDDVGQAVATVGVLLHALQQTPSSIAEELRPSLAATQTSIRQITESVARLVRDYHPAELQDLGLEETLRAHVVQFAQRHGLALELATVASAGLLTHDQELHLYRIAQEALANVARHAHARRVVVRLKRTATALVLTVRDDGVGLGPPAAATTGFGLVTMHERAELMHATLTIQAATRRGTEVRLAVPVAPRPRRPRGPARRPPVARPRVARRLSAV